MKHKLFLSILLKAVVMLAIATIALPQVAEPKTILCAVCKNENDWAYKFCINCGAALAAMKEKNWPHCSVNTRPSAVRC
jgi:hypothetical protein